MKLGITGCNGSIGRRVVALALKRGHQVIGIDITAKADTQDPQFEFRQADIREYSKAEEALQGCEAVIHLAAIITPGDYKTVTHNENVSMSWNVLRACAELGIRRVAQASTVNVITLYFTDKHRFHYFPIDEDHPCLPDEPYGLSKLICEVQADAIVRRYPSMRIASLRPHWSVPSKSVALERDELKSKNDLWGYMQEDSGADAFLLAVTEENGKWSGHEAFFIVAPTIAASRDAKVLRETYWADVPVKPGKDFSGNTVGGGDKHVITHELGRMSVDLPTGVSLEIDLLQPSWQGDQGENKLAVLLHPWSWLGGQMRDPVLDMVAKPLQQNGYHILRFNSRGVGSSTGRASLTGLSEANDLEALVHWALSRVANVQSLVLVGYSHGGLIASMHPVRAANVRTSHALLSYPLSPRGWITLFKSDVYQTRLEQLVRDEDCRVLVLYGDQDEFTSVSKYKRWTDELRGMGKGGGLEIVEMRGGTHFWRGGVGVAMSKVVADWLS
ncbi:hypothetical protein AX17_002319 [Amanita inopinata Kibby_2008]|nr:hypothetical protein AX17_002319 [Amanita inopinata Kibby_2008]